MFHGNGRSQRSSVKTQKSNRKAKGNWESSNRKVRTIPLPLQRVPKGSEGQILERYLACLNAPMAERVWDLYKSGKHRELVELEVDPRSYINIDEFRRDWAAVKLLSKHEGLKTGIDTKKVALDAAHAAEDQCRATNVVFKLQRKGDNYSSRRSELIQLTREKIRSILGRPRGFREVGWSSGRTSSSSGINLSSMRKYTSRPEVTISASSLALQVLRGSPAWGQSALQADGPCSILSLKEYWVQGNTLLIVPKNAKTGRSICYEPHMNIRLQLTVGDLIRRRLEQSGVDLSDQSVNQRRAQHGSIHGHLSTIDLRSASDTLALEVVRELLPDDWFQLLDQLRSRYTQWPDGSWLWNEKFSSMGNGFTFELESLIFFAICSAVSEGVTVYGDDLVVPTENFSSCCEALELFGFRINERKSFSSGHFRESCGGDYFRGQRVTPAYLRRTIRTMKDVMLFHNQIRLWAERSGSIDSNVQSFLVWLRKTFPAPLGPKGYGDGHYHANFEEATPSRAGASLDGWWYTTWIPVFRCSLLGNDRERLIPLRFGAAAIAATTGPKRLFSLWESERDRRLMSYRRHRGLASFCWPNALIT